MLDDPSFLRLIGSIIAIVFRPWLAALILSISSLGRDSRMLFDESILAEEVPSLLGETEAIILTCELFLFSLYLD